MEPKNNNEWHLVKQACSGDKNAFKEIVENNKKKIFYLAFDLTGSKQDAEDLSQDVFIKAFCSLQKFKGNASLSTWLYRITLNSFIDQKRKKSVLNHSPGWECHPTHDESPYSGNPETYAESLQIQQHIEQALHRLTPRERSVFVLRHYRGMAGKEVAELLNISQGTVKSLVFRAVKKLRKELSFYRNNPGKEVNP